MWPNVLETADLVTFTEKIPNFCIVYPSKVGYDLQS